MRVSEFWELADAVFGPTYARTYARELSLTALDSLTPVAALEAGIPARDVWHAWCDEAQVSVAERAGRNPARIVPPRR